MSIFLLKCFCAKNITVGDNYFKLQYIQLFCINGTNDDGIIFQSIKSPSKYLQCMYMIHIALWKENSLELHNECQFSLVQKTLKFRHGGLYRWRENSLPFFLYQKLKEILTRYSRTILTPLKN